VNEMTEVNEISDITSKIYSWDCKLMGITWLLAKNKVVYIPIVSEEFQALMYNGLPHHATTCSVEWQKMPLLVDSSQLDVSTSSYSKPKASFLFVSLPTRPRHYRALLHDAGQGRPKDLDVDFEGKLYTTYADGWVKHVSFLNNDSHASLQVEKWAYVGDRPLGVSLGVHGELLVCEPDQGLLNVTQENVQVLSNEADGFPYKKPPFLSVSSGKKLPIFSTLSFF
ncbi:hypothetical protein KI387_032977, partial [Taxus chinensis]